VFIILGVISVASGLFSLGSML